MIIRTSMAERAATVHAVAAPKLSTREIRRLEHTKHPEGRISPIIKKPVEEEPIIEEAEIRVDDIIENNEPAELVTEEPVIENAEPGTAFVRSKALEEINNSYKATPDTVPKKKYKVISLGE